MSHPEPVQGPGLRKALKDQRPTKEEPHLPPRWVKPALAMYVALAAVAGYLAIDAGPLAPYRWHLGLVLAALGALLGFSTPTVRRALRRLVPLVVLLVLLPATSTLASTATVFGGFGRSTLADEGPRLADFVSFSTAAGVDYRSSRGWTPVADVLGLAHLFRVGKDGPVVSAALGGSFLALPITPKLGAFFGGAVDLPGVPSLQALTPSVAIGGGYDGGWSLRLSIGFRFHDGQ